MKIVKTFEEYHLNEKDELTFKKWLEENKIALKDEYADYKADMKIDGQKDIDTFTEFAKCQYNSQK